MEFSFCPCCATPLARRSIDGDAGRGERLACPSDSCSFVQWRNPTPGVGAIVEHEGEIILDAVETHLVGNYIFERERDERPALRAEHDRR